MEIAECVDGDEGKAGVVAKSEMGDDVFGSREGGREGGDGVNVDVFFIDMYFYSRVSRNMDREFQHRWRLTS